MKLNQQTLTQGNDEILHHGTPRAPKSESRPSNPRNRFRDSRSNEEIEETQSKSEERTNIECYQERNRQARKITVLKEKKEYLARNKLPV
ncbi:hypothetical protein E3N88_22807 [Mikania micrantha]|uniref:Uncharacterized protein n=1 Tax=Mikania micrantha TaxID=192012 RepID=A0A5N6NBH2_9ASTR|nr:hypothetical protein E3N88_22807 [Mikania micrantha]